MSEDKKMFEEGNHKVKVKNWGLRETKSGKLQAYIGFSNNATMFQMVGVSEVGDEILAKALTVCGFKGADLSDLFEEEALDKKSEVEIYLKYKTNSETGKPELSVYVNDPTKKMKGALDKKGASVLLKSLGVSLKKDLKIAREEIKMPEKQEEKEPETANSVSEEEIPF